MTDSVIDQSELPPVVESLSCPDFIIAGAMKCGTTTMHHLLGSHRDIFVPDGELLFFAVDDVTEHPEFFTPCQGGWSWIDFEEQYEVLREWYLEKFADRGSARLVGDDSPVYLSSPVAPRRIAALCPSVKIIVMLRDPVARAYSHYWHWLRTGRAYFSFEKTIRFHPDSILRRGLYREQLQRYFDVLNRSQIKVVLFEEMVQDPGRAAADVAEFLGVPADGFESAGGQTFNSGTIPRFPTLQAFRNRLMPELAARRYLEWLPEMPGPLPISWWKKNLDRVHSRINRRTQRRPPAMPQGVRDFLTGYYRRENRGLDELLNVDLSKHWKSWSSG